MRIFRSSVLLAAVSTGAVDLSQAVSLPWCHLGVQRALELAGISDHPDVRHRAGTAAVRRTAIPSGHAMSLSKQACGLCRGSQDGNSALISEEPSWTLDLETS